MSMNELKKSTYMALIGLLVAGIALATATYAWFANSAITGVDQLTFSATASTALSIAADRENQNITVTKNQDLLDYKGLLTNRDISDYLSKLEKHSDQTLHGLGAVSTVDCKAFFKNDGFNTKEGYVQAFKTAMGTEYLKLPVWFRSNADMKVYLSTNTAINAAGKNEISKYFTRVIRVSFAPMTGDEQMSSLVILEADSSTDSSVSYRKATTFNTQTKKLVPDGYGVQSINGQTVQFEKQDLKSSSDLFVVPPPLGEIPTLDNTIVQGKVEVASLKANVPQKVIIYIWMDGVDYDCVDGISGSTLQVALNFLGVQPK